MTMVIASAYIKFLLFATGMLQKEHPGIAVSVKTHQAARRILNNLRDKILELRGEGLLDENESLKLELVSEEVEWSLVN